MIINESLVAAREVEANALADNDIPVREKTLGQVEPPSLIAHIAAKAPRYSSRVQVLANGEFQCRVHRERAEYLVNSGLATFSDEDRCTKRVWRVHLQFVAATSAQRQGEPSRPHPRHFATAAPVFMQVLGYTDKRLATYAFHRIPKSDASRIAAERDNLRRKM